MSSTADRPAKLIFYKYDVAEQVFYETPESFAFVNLKPLLPGHVLVSPKRITPRLTDLTPTEVTDLFTTVQKTQQMLAQIHFKNSSTTTPDTNILTDQHGSFNIAIQDGIDSGQTIPHVHVHIIPRPANKTNEGNLGHEIYVDMSSEKGNVGGALWDRVMRPKPSGAFPRIEDAEREAREAGVMREEADFYRGEMERWGESS